MSALRCNFFYDIEPIRRKDTARHSVRYRRAAAPHKDADNAGATKRRHNVGRRVKILERGKCHIVCHATVIVT